MDSSVIVAIIAGITSIAVALIQMTTSLRVASPKKITAQPNVVPVEADVSAPVKMQNANRTWLWTGSILVASNILVQLYIGSPYSGYMQFGAVLWCTCLLAYFRPIRWTYVAGAVALINLTSILMSTIQSGFWNSEDLSQASIFYIGNAIVATGIAYLRMRNSVAK